MSQKTIIGREEWCALPALGIPAVKARVDSGAKTSALHAFNIQTFDKDGRTFVRFSINPIQGTRKITTRTEAPLIDRREVKSSSGHVELRYVIRTPIRMGNDTWDAEVTLTNRDTMGYRMLLGRQAMRGRLLVDPERAFCLGKLTTRDVNACYKVETLMRNRGLSIAVLGNNPELYSNKRIIEAGEQRGHTMRFINVKYCYMNISASHSLIHYRGGEILDKVDAIIPRLRPSMTFHGCAVTRHFETAGIFALNDAASIACSRDKLKSLQVLAQKGVEMPLTGFAHSIEDTKDLIEMVGGAPLIIKLLEGTQGRGVVLADTKKAAESVINAFKSLQANILVQEFVKEAGGRDIRCFVVDGKVVGSMERRAAEGEFRANLHLGGTSGPIKITGEERRMAVLAAKAMGLKVAGVDIIRSDTGPKVLEVNSSPGLEGIEQATGKDIAGMMIECIERHVIGDMPKKLIA
ncbi:MAG: 30S ribosomal protein S6--L-glutamate ligase [Rickettsiales bacterium]